MIENQKVIATVNILKEYSIFKKLEKINLEK